MVNKALLTSLTDEWETPQDLFEELDSEFHFTLDVCANAQNHKCAQYYTKADDGLKMPWGGGYLVQSSLWPRSWQMGGEVCQLPRPCGHATTCEDRYKMVPRVHIQQSRSAIYQRTAQVWWEQELSSIPKHGRSVQKGEI